MPKAKFAPAPPRALHASHVDLRSRNGKIIAVLPLLLALILWGMGQGTIALVVLIIGLAILGVALLKAAKSIMAEAQGMDDAPAPMAAPDMDLPMPPPVAPAQPDMAHGYAVPAGDAFGAPFAPAVSDGPYADHMVEVIQYSKRLDEAIQVAGMSGDWNPLVGLRAEARGIYEASPAGEPAEMVARHAHMMFLRTLAGVASAQSIDAIRDAAGELSQVRQQMTADRALGAWATEHRTR